MRNETIKKVSTLMWILSFTLLLNSCALPKTNKNEEDKIVSIRITSKFPFFSWGDPYNPKLIRYDSLKTNIFYFKNQMIYNRFYHWNEVDTSGNSLRYEYRSNYLVFSKGNKKGLFFDSYKEVYERIVSVDSLLSREWSVNASFIDSLNLTLISSKKDEKSGDLKETYSFKGKTDTSINGNLHLQYTNEDNLKNIPYSFSKRLDSLKR